MRDLLTSYEEAADCQQWQSGIMLLLPDIASSYNIKLGQAHGMLLLGLLIHCLHGRLRSLLWIRLAAHAG